MLFRLLVAEPLSRELFGPVLVSGVVTGEVAPELGLSEAVFPVEGLFPEAVFPEAVFSVEESFSEAVFPVEESFSEAMFPVEESFPDAVFPVEESFPEAVFPVEESFSEAVFPVEGLFSAALVLVSELLELEELFAFSRDNVPSFLTTTMESPDPSLCRDGMVTSESSVPITIWLLRVALAL